jgi:hypothetical protein
MDLTEMGREHNYVELQFNWMRKKPNSGLF